MKEGTIFFRILWDFLRELPMDYNPNHTTVSQGDDIINDFMKRHGLDEEPEE